MKEANENRSENGTLNGVVIDAMTGEGVPAAKLEFKAKENAENSTHVTSGKDGSFSIELAADVYEVTISADGYVDETFEFEMEKDKITAESSLRFHRSWRRAARVSYWNGTHSIRISTRICGEIRIKEMTCT